MHKKTRKKRVIIVGKVMSVDLVGILETVP